MTESMADLARGKKMNVEEAKKSRQDIFFTVVDAETGAERRVEINFCDLVRGEPTKVCFPSPTVSIDSQQLAELGHLLVALSRHDYDTDSVHELIDGYGFDCLVPIAGM